MRQPASVTTSVGDCVASKLEIFRFNRGSRKFNAGDDLSLTLGEYLQVHGYSRAFIEQFLVPMGSAIWSADPERFLLFPATAFVTFFTNHGILNVIDQPRWRVVSGGSRQYVEPLVRPFRDRVRLAAPVARVERYLDRVELTVRGDVSQSFDQVVLACHSDQALAILADPSPLERELLGSIPYQKNEAILHTDAAQLPSLPKARASWNSRIPLEQRAAPSLTYWMNRLQSLQAPVEFCVTLNAADEIAADKVHFRTTYEHPVYSAAAFAAQRRREELNGVNRTWYCGAYWGYGFHEDGLNSALAVCRRFGRSL